MDEERAKLTSVDTGEESPLKQKKLFEMDKFGLGAFALTVLTGAILGCINIPLGAGSFNLGTTGGPLIMGLIFGHFGRIGKLSMKVNKHLLEVFQEWGLVLFLIGAGVDGGAGFVQTLEKYGPLLFLWGALMTIIPLFIGFFLAKKVLKAEPVQQPRFYHRRYDQHTGSGCSHQYQRHTERCKCLRCNLSDRTGTGGSGIAVPHISLNLFETKKPVRTMALRCGRVYDFTACTI